MRKLKTFIIITAIILLALFVGLGFLVIPIIAKLLSPIWTDLLVPYREYIAIGLFSFFTTVLSFKNWWLWIKIVIFLLLFSAAASISGLSLIVIGAQAVYQIIAATFIIVTVVVKLLR